MAQHIVGEPSRVGLEFWARQLPSSVTVNDWRRELEAVEASCNVAKGYENTCNVDAVAQKSLCPPKLSGFSPFPVYWGEKCLRTDIPVGAEERGRQQILNTRSAVWAQELSNGVLSDSPSFRTVAQPLSDQVMSLKSAIGLLYKNRILKHAPGRHFIHVPATFAFEASQLAIDPNYAIVIDDYRYTPELTLPNGDLVTAAGTNEDWITITGQVEYGVTNPEWASADGIDAKQKNSYFVRYEQQTILRFDTCNVFAVKARLVDC